MRRGEEEMMAKAAKRTGREYLFRRNRDQFMVNIGNANKFELHSSATVMLQLTILMAYMYLKKDGFDLRIQFLRKGFFLDVVVFYYNEHVCILLRHGQSHHYMCVTHGVVEIPHYNVL